MSQNDRADTDGQESQRIDVFNNGVQLLDRALTTENLEFGVD